MPERDYSPTRQSSAPSLEYPAKTSRFRRGIAGFLRRETAPQAVDFGIDYDAASNILPAQQLTVAPSGAHTYPASSNVPTLKIERTTESENAALIRFRDLFDTPNLEILSNEGTSALVMTDGSLAYKAARHSSYYSYFENETAALALLHAEGLAPKPIALIDAALEWRKDRKEPRRDFPNVLIPRKDGGGELPVIVMERIETAPLRESLNADQMYGEFLRIMDAANRHSLQFGDVELFYDTSAKSVKFLDVGGVSHVSIKSKFAQHFDGSYEDSYPHMSKKEFIQASAAQQVSWLFGIRGESARSNTQFFADVIRNGNLEYYLKNLWDNPLEITPLQPISADSIIRLRPPQS